jgi:cytoskeleton protein RodZ
MSHNDLQTLTEEDAAPEPEPSVGERLKAARAAQPLSLVQISAELRVEPHLLTALEEDRFDSFPAPVFAKGYLKQYGGILGLDERELLEQYDRQAEARDVPVVPQKPIRLRDEEQIRHWLIAAVLLALLGTAAVVWWTAQPELAPVVIEPADPEPPPVPTEAVVAEPATPAPAGGQEPAPETSEAGPAAAAALGPERPIGAPEPTAAASVEVEISFVEDCWTEISDARGERLFYGLGSAGARSRFSAALPISVFLGNASGVELTVDGSQYPVPAAGRQGNLARFVIAGSGI